MSAVVVGRSVRIVRINRVIRPREIHVPGPCVMGQELEPLRESFVHFYLERLVIIARVAGKITKVLAPTELLEIRLALIRGERAEACQRRLIGIVVAAGA